MFWMVFCQVIPYNFKVKRLTTSKIIVEINIFKSEKTYANIEVYLLCYTSNVQKIRPWA